MKSREGLRCTRERNLPTVFEHGAVASPFQPPGNCSTTSQSPSSGCPPRPSMRRQRAGPVAVLARARPLPPARRVLARGRVEALRREHGTQVSSTPQHRPGPGPVRAPSSSAVELRNGWPSSAGGSRCEAPARPSARPKEPHHPPEQSSCGRPLVEL